ncbi:MAG TPA: DUF1501 domain-containing protein, partial [Blastocatellia bacterium]|nr:DUF1501 domain-containing protein [Blastocatellia bacterium]
MKRKEKLSRREFLQLSASVGMVAALGQFKLTQAAAAQDYKALVCVFMFGGNDGHNMVVPMGSTQYNAYVAARGAVALPPAQLLPINDPAQGQFGLHFGLPELQSLYQQGQMAIVSNVGVLVRPTSFQDFQAANQLPTNLRSHADQVVLMQTGFPNASGSTGWGGRAVDLMTAANSGTTFPVSISMSGTAVFCTGAVVQSASLQPGNQLDQDALLAGPTVGQARATAQQNILAAGSSNSMVQAANRVMSRALALGPILKTAAGNPSFKTVFPQTALGSQLQEVAHLISLKSQLGAGRQVFFCSLGGFDTHSGQAFQQWSLLQQVSQAISAFYNATVEIGAAADVTTITLSDFGRTLQPSGSGTDHGWGNHNLVVGGAVNGGRIYGQFPLMTNYANFNSTSDDYADTRGVMLPSTSLAQYGATLAKWFGASDGQLDGVFPTLANFATRDLGFMQ